MLSPSPINDFELPKVITTCLEVVQRHDETEAPVNENNNEHLNI